MSEAVRDATTRFDVTSFGSTMIRLSVPRGERLESAPIYQVHTAGSESNTMAALARMGKRTAWASRLKDDALGRRIASDIGRHGVDTSRIVWTDEARNEVFFVEHGADPRPTQVIYDRKHSALAAIRPEDIDQSFLLNTRVLHLTGILPALSPGCADVTRSLLAAAASAGVKVSFDVNFRGKLWSPSEAECVLTPMVAGADILIATEEDARDVFNITGTPEDVTTAFHKRFRLELVVVTRGGEGAIAYDGHGFLRREAFRVDAVDRLGAGDAFAAGVLCGWLEGSVERGMDYARAMAALKLGIRGDYFLSNREEVAMVLESGGRREVGR